MDKQLLKANRRKLHQIYVTHDVTAFREFVREMSQFKPTLVGWDEKPDDVLSELMYEEKAKLVYLGPVWIEARNHKRMKKFWDGLTLEEYPVDISRIAVANEGKLPHCMTCHYFRSPPKKGQACVNIGAIPEDVCCPGYKPLKSGIR